MRRLLACLIPLVVLLTGCVATGGSAAPEPTAAVTPASTPVPGADPIELIGMWRVSQTEEAGANTWLRLTGGGFEVSRDCGALEGSWVGDSGTFRAVVNGGAPECFGLPPGTPLVAWLDDAVTFERAGEGWVLEDEDGVTVAALAPERDAVDVAWTRPGSSAPPVVDARAREYFHGVVAVPAGMVPVDAESIVGRWVPRRSYSTDPHVEFTVQGEWTGTDGCNGGGGRWILSATGDFRSTSSAHTLVGCEGEQAPRWVESARALAFDGDELVFLDADGDELGRLVSA